MKNKEFLNENVGRIYEYNGLLVELVGYTNDYPGATPGTLNIVRYLSPDKARGRAGSWGILIDRVIVVGYNNEYPDVVIVSPASGNFLTPRTL